MKIKYKHWLPKILKVTGITINKTIYFAIPEQEVSSRLRKHEYEHIKQYQESGVVGFLVKYIWEYIKNRIKGLNHYEAYYNISYEVKARKAAREVEKES